MTNDTGLVQRIRERAFQIWIEEGKPLGRDTEHWQRAEQEIAGGEGEQPHKQAPPRQPPEPKYAEDALVGQDEKKMPPQ